MFSQAFANIALSLPGGPFIAVTAHWPGTPVTDAGGSIVTPAVPVNLPCKAQFDAATQAMRLTEGFVETDVRILVLSASLARALDEKARIIVASGERAGTWALLSVTRDPVGIGWEARGRKVS